MDGTSDVRNVLEEVQMELIKNSMLKLWLEDYYNFCQVRHLLDTSFGGSTLRVQFSPIERRHFVCIAGDWW